LEIPRGTAKIWRSSTSPFVHDAREEAEDTPMIFANCEIKPATIIYSSVEKNPHQEELTNDFKFNYRKPRPGAQTAPDLFWLIVHNCAYAKL
jgi:hypothetical protein